MSPQDIIFRKPYLAWYVKNPAQLSDESVLEHVLNYGDWNDVQAYINMKGIQETAKIFYDQAQSERSNYFPEIKHYFGKYFAKYAH